MLERSFQEFPTILTRQDYEHQSVFSYKSRQYSASRYIVTLLSSLPIFLSDLSCKSILSILLEPLASRIRCCSLISDLEISSLHELMYRRLSEQHGNCKDLPVERDQPRRRLARVDRLAAGGELTRIKTGVRPKWAACNHVGPHNRPALDPLPRFGGAG